MSDSSRKHSPTPIFDALRALFEADTMPLAVDGSAALVARPLAPASGGTGPLGRDDEGSGVHPRLSPVSRPRRIQAPVVCRPAGLRLFAPSNRRDARVRHVCMYSDQAIPLGERLELEVFLDGENATFTAQVERVEPLVDARPARFDIVLEVTRVDKRSADALVGVLA